jgi:hypothetical protein
VRETLGADGFAEVGDGGRVAEEVLEAHGFSLGHGGAFSFQLSAFSC